MTLIFPKATRAGFNGDGIAVRGPLVGNDYRMQIQDTTLIDLDLLMTWSMVKPDRANPRYKL